MIDDSQTYSCELRDCPLCASVVKLQKECDCLFCRLISFRQPNWFIRCKCGVLIEKRDPFELVKLWNQRPQT